jgi:hypothetical protein
VRGSLQALDDDVVALAQFGKAGRTGHAALVRLPLAPDLGADPGEKRPVPAGKSPLVGVLDRFLDEQKAAATAFREKFGAESEALDPEQVERLRSLGYVQ